METYLREDTDHVERSNRYYDMVTGLYRQFYGDHFHMCFQRPGEPRETAMARMNEMFLDEANVVPGCRVIDLGGGVGGLSILAAKRKAASVTCVNINDYQLTLAKKRARAAGVKVDFVKEDILALSLDSQFDAAFLIDVDSHLPDKRKALRRIAGVLAPGARLVIQAWLHREKPSPLEKEFFLRPLCRCIGLSNLGTFDLYRRLFAEEGFRVLRFDDTTEEIHYFMEVLYREQIELARTGMSLASMVKAITNPALLQALSRGAARSAIDEAFRGVLYLKLCVDAGLFQLGHFVVEAR